MEIGSRLVLFIAYTPLHAMIIQRIILNEKIHNYSVIYFFEKKTNQSDYYFNLIKVGSKESYYLKKKFNLKFFLLLFRIVFADRSKNTHVVTGNLKTMFSRMIIFITSSRISTYDDGIANLVNTGYLAEMKEGRMSTFLFSILNKRYLYKELVKEIEKHYTIYDNPVIYRNSKIVNLNFNFERPNKIETNPINKSVSFFLSSVFSESNLISKELELEISTKIIDEFKIDYIILHPRTLYRKYKEGNNVLVINDIRIAEEIVLEMSSKYEQVNVYGIYSTALINLSNHNNLQITNLKFKSDFFSKKVYEELESLFLAMNIKTVEI